MTRTVRPACADQDPELFYPVYAEPGYDEQVAAAKAVCRRCPVLEQCLESPGARSQYGIFAGMTAGERYAWRNARQPGPRIVRRRNRTAREAVTAAADGPQRYAA